MVVADQKLQVIVMAEVVKAVGLKGEVKLYPLLDFFAPILDSDYLVWGDGSPLRISGHRPAGSCEVVRIPSCDNRSAAEALVGRTLGFVRQSYGEEDFPRPDQGLPFRWLGRNVVTVDHCPVGEVGEVRWTGGQYLLVVMQGEREILIPAVQPILTVNQELDGDLVIDPPSGLLEVGFG